MIAEAIDTATLGWAADIPAPYAGLVIALVSIAVAFLMTVDWTHPDNHTNPKEHR